MKVKVEWTTSEGKYVEFIKGIILKRSSLIAPIQFRLDPEGIVALPNIPDFLSISFEE